MMATSISFGLLAALSGRRCEVHEKTAKFIGRLRAADIYEGEEDVCLECFKDEYIDDRFGRHRYTVAIGQDERILLVAALLEAGISLEEVRGRLVQTGVDYGDAELMLGKWALIGCVRVHPLIDWVERLHASSTREE